jgi:tellurite resistance protein
VPLGEFEWAAAHFGIALFFWPVLVALLGVRILVHGSWPERMRPSTLIFIAPPALVGLAAMRLGAPPVVGWMCWGAAVFSLAWVATQSRAIAALPFSIGHWGMGFPLCALCTLTLRLAAPGSLAAAAGVAMLVACSLLLTALTLATVRGLRDGSLLAPETVATIATRGSPQNSPQGPSQAPPV